MEFTNIGAGWIKKEDDKKPRISVKLNNGMFITIFKNTKKERDNQPDYNLTMNTEDAEKMGLQKQDYKKNETVVTSDNEIDIEDIPF